MAQERSPYQNRVELLQGTLDMKKQLARDRSKWETMVAAIGNILSPTPEG